MSVYTVHEPPLRAAEALPDPDRVMFVRDGFHFWAFIAPTLWLLWHRLWLVLVLYVVIAAGLAAAMGYAGLSAAEIIVVELLISLLIGIEVATLRRFTLARRGWKNVGVVCGDDVESAEQRFFHAWAGTPDIEFSSGGPAAAAPGIGIPQSGVIGLFPEPGASR